MLVENFSQVLNSYNTKLLSELQFSLELADSFALFFAVVNLLEQRDALIAQLEMTLELQGHYIKRLDLNTNKNLVTALLDSLESTPSGGSLHIYNFERYISFDGSNSQVLSQLNLAREHFLQFTVPLVFWITDEILTNLIYGAPDFWAWRSDVFEFEVDKQSAKSGEFYDIYQSYPERIPVWSSSLQKSNSQRILLLSEQLREYQISGEHKSNNIYYADIYLELGQLYSKTDHWMTALENLNNALHLYTQIGDKLGMANAYYTLGDVYTYQNRGKEALVKYKMAVELYHIIGETLLEARAVKALGDVLRYNNEQDKALAKYKESLALYQTVEDILGKAQVYKSLGDILLSSAQISAALENYQSAMELYQNTGDVLGQANMLKTFGDIQRSEGNLGVALENYQSAMVLYQELDDNLGQANTLRALGDSQYLQKDFNAAIESYNSAIELYEEQENNLGLANTLQSLGRVAVRQGQNESALDYFNRAQELYTVIQDRYSQAVNRFYRAELLMVLKRNIEAREDLEFTLKVFKELNLPYVDLVIERLKVLDGH